MALHNGTDPLNGASRTQRTLESRFIWLATLAALVCYGAEAAVKPQQQIATLRYMQYPIL